MGREEGGGFRMGNTREEGENGVGTGGEKKEALGMWCRRDGWWEWTGDPRRAK